MTDGDGNQASMQVHVTVFELSVGIKVGGQIQYLSDAHWSVLHYDNVYVSDELTSPRAGTFHFKVGIPAAAGFQANTNRCSWPHTTTKQWSGWVAEDVDSFALVRCALGTGGYFSIDMQVREGGPGGVIHDLPGVLVYHIPQA